MRAVILIVALLGSLLTFAQDYGPDPGAKKIKDKEPKSFKDKLYYGGNVALQFGSSAGGNYTFIEVSPLVGYRVTEKYSVGVGVNNVYYSNLYGSFYVYGGRVFNRYLITDNIFAHAEYLNLNFPVHLSGRKWYPRALLGAGYRYQIGGNVSLYAIALYDLLYPTYSTSTAGYPYGSPWDIRIGFGIGF